MNKADLIVKLAPKINMSQDQTREILSAVIETFEEALTESKGIRLVGFGSFEVKKRQARIGRNPKTGETVKIEEKEVVTFKVGKNLHNKINAKPKKRKTR